MSICIMIQYVVLRCIVLHCIMVYAEMWQLTAILPRAPHAEGQCPRGTCLPCQHAVLYLTWLQQAGMHMLTDESSLHLLAHLHAQFAPALQSLLCQHYKSTCIGHMPHKHAPQTVYCQPELPKLIRRSGGHAILKAPWLHCRLRPHYTTSMPW